MNKQELIHVHGLLAEVHRWYADREQECNCPTYHAHGVWPTTIPAPKADHEKAIRLLATALATEMASTHVDPVGVEAN